MPATAKRSSKNPYSPHPGIAMIQKWISELKGKTGRDLDEWMKYIRTKGPKEQNECIAWLKEQGIGTNTAWWLYERAAGKPRSFAEDTPEEYLKVAVKYADEQYQGKKAHLRPLYDRLLDLCLGVGDEAKACPCQTIVPLYRNHVFAQLKATTNSRVDLGLALAKMTDGQIAKGGKRLIDTGGKARKDRITHRIPIEKDGDIDGYVEKWIKAAYDLDEK